MENFSLADLIWPFISLCLLCVWLIKQDKKTLLLHDAPTNHHKLGVFEIYISITILVVSLSLLRHYHSTKEIIEWQTKDNFFCLGIIALGITPLLIAFVKTNSNIESGLFGFRLTNFFSQWTMSTFYYIITNGITHLVLITTIWICSLVGYEEVQIHSTLEDLLSSTHLREKLIPILTTVILTPIWEEFIFRGCFQPLVIKGLNLTNKSRPPKPIVRWTAIIVTSCLFASWHADLQHWPALTIFSILLGYIYERHGNLFIPILIHALFNGVMIFTLLLFK